MGYMIEITHEGKGELMKHAEEVYEHAANLLECIKKLVKEDDDHHEEFVEMI